MKLSEYMPEMPGMAQQMLDMNEGLNFIQLMKQQGQQGDKAASPSIGLDHIVNTWVRHQMAYRQQLVQDLQTIAFSVAETTFFNLLVTSFSWIDKSFSLLLKIVYLSIFKFVLYCSSKADVIALFIKNICSCFENFSLYDNLCLGYFS